MKKSKSSNIKKQNKKYFIHLKENTIPIENFDFYDIKKLNKIANGSVKEIYVQDLFDFYTDNMTIGLLNDLANKLSKDGILHIQATDAINLSISLIYKQIDINIYKTIIFNNNRINIFSMSKLVKIIQESGRFTISKRKFINGLQYYIECKVK